MYIREEHIEEENLDWENKEKASLKDKKLKIKKKIPPMGMNHKKLLSIEKNELDENLDKNLGESGKVSTFLNDHVKLFSITMLLIFPYIVGFLITYILFYVYGGMTLGTFFSVEAGHLHVQLWTIGAYLFVITWVSWAFLHILKILK